MKGGYPTKKNHVREILTPENLASEGEKITHRPDFFTWMRALDPGGLGHIVGGPRRLDRAIRGPRTTPPAYILFGNSLNLRISKFH